MATNRFSVLAVAALLLASPASGRQIANGRMHAAPRFERNVDAVAAQALASHSTAGLAIGIARAGQPLFVRGYGFANLETRTPVTAATVFRIGSITKEFTAAAILLLVERGKLSLDDPLSSYVPSFPRGGEVTIRQLLAHTSGIHSYTSAADFFSAVSHHEHSSAEMVAVIARAQPLYDFSPGTSYSYSNSGFFLLGAVIEKVSGLPYDKFVQANVLDPLGLKDTRLDNPLEVVPNRASGYDRAKDAPSGFANADYISVTVAAAAGAMRSTVSDLIRWHQALLGGKLLQPSSLAMMTTPGQLRNGALASSTAAPRKDKEPTSDYGFGITIGYQHGRRTIGHGGAINGFSASLASYPDQKVTIVILSNTAGGVVELPAKVADAVFAAQR